MLYPLLASGYTDRTGAPDAHMQLFGYRPEHPDSGNWTWEDGDLTSTTYGHINQRELPEHKKGDDNFGLMKKIKKLSVETQFEADGLRTRVRWQMR